MRNRTRLRVCPIFQALAATLILLLLSGCSSGKVVTAVLHIESEPEGATVKIVGGKIKIPGGKSYGTTPTTIRGLPAGKYHVILNQDGYRQKSEPVDLREADEVRIVVQMLRRAGRLTFKSEPSGAQVYLDGEHVGETPFEVEEIPIGPHSYEMRLNDYEYFEGKVEIEEDRHPTVTEFLVPMKGKIQVSSLPTNAAIYIDDALKEKTTTARFPVKPGTYTIRVQKQGHIMDEKVVEVAPNEEVSVNFVLEEGEVPEGMTFIPAGSFIMGQSGHAADEAPERQVHLDAYCIDKHEVTNQEFKQIFPEHTFGPRRADFPVQGVSWNDAVKYAEAVGKRLPTEAEWEKAARGPNGREWPWGNTFDSALCNSAEGENPLGRTTKVGYHQEGKSFYGLMDMAGNVYEWISDRYQPYPGNHDIKEEYTVKDKVLRGGSYRSDEYHVRALRRHYDDWDSRRVDYGFRCAKDVEDLGSRN